MYSDVYMRRGHTRQETKIPHTHTSRVSAYTGTFRVSRAEVTHTRCAYTGTFRLTFLRRSKDIISEASVTRKKGENEEKEETNRAHNIYAPTHKTNIFPF